MIKRKYLYEKYMNGNNSIFQFNETPVVIISHVYDIYKFGNNPKNKNVDSYSKWSIVKDGGQI